MPDVYERPLDERTLAFAKDTLKFTKSLPRSIENNVLIRQVVRSGTSVGANYREGNDALSKKDRIHRFRISRKEAKETLYWFELIESQNPDTSGLGKLKNEITELIRILSVIISKLS